jgi:hypothetical protein
MSLETMTKLATYTVAAGGTITEVVFDNIPQGYTDLKILVSARDGTTSGIGSALLGIKLNNDASATQGSHLILYGTGSSMASAKYTNVQFVWASFLTNTSNTSSTFSNVEINISNYSDNQIKVWSADGTTENDATAAYSSFVSGAWNNSSPITMLTVYDYGGSYYFAQHSTFTLYGIKDAIKTAGNSIKATGGNIVFDGTYVYHIYPASGTFTPTQSLTADCLVVAGGAGGGRSGGGGGAGGLLAFTSQSLTATGYTVTVGGGGAGNNVDNQTGTSGGDSQFAALTLVKGGGGGGSYGANGASGASGGGGGGFEGGTKTGGSATPSGQGNAGGNGFNGSSSLNRAGGGGGGAGASGAAAASAVGGNGGIGSSTYSSWGVSTGIGQNVSGTYYLAGGGGGYAATGGTGGSGGGGGKGVNGTANTGGGGGGSASDGTVGFNGGSGVVIVRYKG